MNLPTGTVTFLFTDIEGSTKLWEQYPEEMRPVLARHDTLVRNAIEKNHGLVFKTIGDAFCAAFETAGDAIVAAVEAQQCVFSEHWPGHIAIRVRMGVVTGSPELRDSDYFGPALNRASRIMSAGHGGQILVSSTTRDLLHNSVTLEDLGSHRLRDVPQLERIYQLVHPFLPPGLPPLRTLAETVHNQPQQLTAFVGRNAEISEWSEFIRERSRRLFTLTGFGGLGKTRVAMRLGEVLSPDFPDGVWWCNLEQANTIEDAVARVAQALSIPLQPTPGVKEQIFRYLRERNTLLILDNVEQITGGPSLLKELLTETRECVCLITSRRAMELRGETVLELAPMPASEAVDLFSYRASECRADFIVDGDNRADVQELCRRLEGVPLAIELAAARITGMTPRQILQRLNERFRLLQSRSEELNERQRALRGAIDWSYALLGDDEKQVFAQLSVFSGGFTLEDAEAVCDAFDVFESVMALRLQSFLRVEESTLAHEQRFVMLDSLREYGAEKLSETDDSGSQAKLRHAKWFLRYSQERIARLRTAKELQALIELRDCENNVRTALDWAASAKDVQLYGDLSLAFGTMRYRRGFVQSAAEIFQSGLDSVRIHVSAYPSLAAKLMLERAGLHYDFRQAAECASLAREALPLLEGVSDKHGIAKVENLLGKAAMIEKRFTEAISHYERAQALFEEAGDKLGVAIALNNHGLAERRDKSGSEAEVAERMKRASGHLHEALRLRRALHDQRGLAETLNNLGVLSFELAEYARAWDYYRESLENERQLDNRNGIGITLANLGEVAGLQGNAVLGAKLLIVSEYLFTEAGSPLAAEVRTMFDEAAVNSGWSATEVGVHRMSLKSLTISQRCDWALEGAVNSTESV